MHKYNLYDKAKAIKNRVWRKPGEVLQLTAKGSKDMPGVRRIHVIQCIQYGIWYRSSLIALQPLLRDFWLLSRRSVLAMK